jgi:serine/threonine protein kinase
MIGTVLGDKYKIEQKIGKGGFGTVYKGHDLKLNRSVAIKVMNEFDPGSSFERKFNREMESLAKLNHPNIVTIYDAGEHKRLPYFVMEYVDGPALMDLVERSPLTLPQACRFAEGICKGMAFAHDLGIIHRDLTLRNIMLAKSSAEGEQVRILDFGLAKLVHPQLTTTSHGTAGTPQFMAPEQIRGDRVDERTDIFAFGVGFYRLVSGRFPFEAEHPTALMYLILNELDVGFSKEVPDEINSILKQCLEKDPQNRPRDFNEILDHLAAVQGVANGASNPSRIDSQVIRDLSERRDVGRNPYVNRVMIQNPSDFFGRRREVRKIFSRLDAPHPQSISIVGDRRIGKSSLLNHVYHTEKRRRYMQNHESAIFIFMDFQRHSDFGIEGYIDLLFGLLEYETKGSIEVSNRERTLEQLKAVVEAINAEEKRLIILMDEFDSITGNERFEEHFFSYLRSLANSYRVAYVTSSYQELQLMCHNKDISDSPFFNIFSNLPLRPFTRDEALELISLPSKTEGIPLEPFADKIVELAGLFPFYLQIACSNVFESLLDNPESEPDWTIVTRDFNEEAFPHYQFVWDHMDESFRENLSRLAHGKTISKKFGFVNDELIRRGYLLDSGGSPAICSSSFEGFVRRQNEKSQNKGAFFSSFWKKKR